MNPNADKCDLLGNKSSAWWIHIFNMWTLNRFIVYFSTMIISVSGKYFFMYVHNPVRFLLWWPRNATHGKMRTRNTSGVGSSVAVLDVGIISHLLARTQPCHRKCLFLPIVFIYMHFGFEIEIFTIQCAFRKYLLTCFLMPEYWVECSESRVKLCVQTHEIGTQTEIPKALSSIHIISSTPFFSAPLCCLLREQIKLNRCE